MSTEFISFLPPPGDTIAAYDRSAGISQPVGVPSIFIEAMSIREQVFVHEQGVPLENELDIDDAKCYHWVAYASVGTTAADDNTASGRSRDGMGNRVPVGTIRLVPPPHPPHPESQSHHQIDNSEADVASPNVEHDSEPYIKLGRLSVIKAYRSLGLSRLLISAAVEWAANNPEKLVPAVEPSEVEKLRLEGRDVPELWNGRILVHAQTSVQGLWAKNGFVLDQEMGSWDEEGIDHVGMWRTVKVHRKQVFLKDP